MNKKQVKSVKRDLNTIAQRFKGKKAIIPEMRMHNKSKRGE